MEHQFWFDKWQRNEIGFHKDEVNPVLLDFLERLALTQGRRIFLPLCGKTLDIGWLLGRGYRVAGAELSESAVQQLFDNLGATPEVSQRGRLRRYSASGVDIYAGDIFDLTREELGEVDGTYDRAALVALPAGMRRRYSRHLVALTGAAQQLLVSFDYDQRQLEGPPFAVLENEIRDLYGDTYDLSQLDRRAEPGGLKGKCEAWEVVWLLEPTQVQPD